MTVGGPYSTSGDGSVSCLAVPSGYQLNQLQIINNGTLGFFSIDGGTTWRGLPAAQMAPVDATTITGANVLIKRIGGGTDLSGVWMVLQTPAPAPTPTGTITGVTAGTGLSGGGTSGVVTLTNTAPGESPAGTGSELQFRSTGSAFGALTGSSVSGANLALAGTLTMPAGGTVTTLQTGTSGGDLTISPSAAVSGGSVGGALNLIVASNLGAQSTGGPVNIQGGGGAGNFGGGSINIKAGDSATSTFSAVGSVNITAGNITGAAAPGGDIVLTPGTGSANGHIKLVSIPTSDPHVANALYTTAGALMVSAG